MHSISIKKTDDYNTVTYFETHISNLINRCVRSSLAPAPGNISWTLAIGPAIVSNVWPSEQALVRPSVFMYSFSFVILETMLKMGWRGERIQDAPQSITFCVVVS